MPAKIRIRYRPSGPGIVLQSLSLELPNGTDAVIGWRESIKAPAGPDGAETILCSGIELEGRGTPGFQELSRARILSVSWRGPDGPSTGAVRSMDAWAVDGDGGVQVPIRSYAKDFPSEVPWPDLDRGARPMVQYLRGSGLPTEKSCSGHPGTPDKRFWVSFRDDVTDQDVARFMDAHAAPGRRFEARGMFCARYDKARGGGIRKTLQYTAPDLLDAMLDLAGWAADEMSGEPGSCRDGAVGQTAVRLCTENMDPATADALYRAVWKGHVLEDIRSRVDDLDEEPLAPEQEDYAAELYVYEGKYDCNLCYWDNIDNVIQTAREFA